MVELLTNSRDTTSLSVLVVSCIATPLQDTSITVNHLISVIFYNLQLAHPLNAEQEFEISLLIGADHYSGIVKDHVVRAMGPTVVDFNLLSGTIQPSYRLCGKVCMETRSSHLANQSSLDRMKNMSTSKQTSQKTSTTSQSNKPEAALNMWNHQMESPRSTTFHTMPMRRIQQRLSVLYLTVVADNHLASYPCLTGWICWANQLE